MIGELTAGQTAFISFILLAIAFGMVFLIMFVKWLITPKDVKEVLPESEEEDE